MKLPIQISISRTSSDVIKIELRDPRAVVRFAQIEMTPHQFAMAITGLSAIEVDSELQGLEKVGKVRVHEARSKLCTDPMCNYDRRKQEKWLLINAQEESWELDTYLGSQDSISHTPEGPVLNYSVSRWEEAK